MVFVFIVQEILIKKFYFKFCRFGKQKLKCELLDCLFRASRVVRVLVLLTIKLFRLFDSRMMLKRGRDVFTSNLYAVCGAVDSFIVSSDTKYATNVVDNANRYCLFLASKSFSVNTKSLRQSVNQTSEGEGKCDEKEGICCSKYTTGSYASSYRTRSYHRLSRHFQTKSFFQLFKMTSCQDCHSCFLTQKEVVRQITAKVSIVTLHLFVSCPIPICFSERGLVRVR